MKITRILMFMMGITLFLGCTKSPLEAPYNKIEGKYEWQHTSYREHALGDLKYKNANSSDFSAQVEFLENRIVKFYINEVELGSSKFDVTTESTNETGIQLEIKIKVKESELDFNKTLSLNLIGEDSLYVDDYPYFAYEQLDGTNKTNLFIRK